MTALTVVLVLLGSDDELQRRVDASQLQMQELMLQEMRKAFDQAGDSDRTKAACEIVAKRPVTAAEERANEAALAGVLAQEIAWRSRPSAAAGYRRMKRDLCERTIVTHTTTKIHSSTGGPTEKSVETSISLGGPTKRFLEGSYDFANDPD